MCGAIEAALAPPKELRPGAAPGFFFKNRGVLVPLRAILAIERPIKLMSDLPETTVIQGEHYNSGDLEYFSVTGQWLII